MTAGSRSPIAASEVAALVGGRLAGDGSLLLRGVRSLSQAGPDELSFVADPREESRANDSHAGALLVKSVLRFPGRLAIEVADPLLALVEILNLFHPRRVARPGIHPTTILGAGSVVAPGAEVGPYVVIGEDSRVEDGAILEAHVVLGRDCVVGPASRLHPHVTLYDDVQLGARVEIHSGTVLGADGFGYAPSPTGIRKIPQIGGVRIESDVEIGANTCVDRASLEQTKVGQGTKIDDLVMVAHNCEIGRHCFVCSQVGLAGSTVVGDGVVIGGQVGVAGHLKIGNGVKVGAQSGINGDVPDGTSVNGSPHMGYRESLKSLIEFRRLPETARLVRELALKLEAHQDRSK
ncbi:MAG: UDP-3-O-(3-hydroxymyristoyl)glucosamine N-acyltransferase [Thermoanaerobaculia bacterium]